MSRDEFVSGALNGAGSSVAGLAVQGVVAGLTDEGESKAEEAAAYSADVLTVVNMTDYNHNIIRRLGDLSASFSEGARDRLQPYLQPVHIKKTFLGLNTERWTFRGPSLKNQATIARAERYYHTYDDERFRIIFVTIADYAINTFQHERTRLKNKLKFRRKDEEVNNRKVFFVSQLMNMLYVIFDEYKTTNNKDEAILNLKNVLEFSQGIIDEAESGEKIWRTGGEPVSFSGVLQQISDLLHTSIKKFQQPERPSPVKATESLIQILDRFSNASLVIFMSHVLSKPLPMNAIYLLKKIHHISELAKSGDPLYAIRVSTDQYQAIRARCYSIARRVESKRSLSDQLYMELFSEVDDETNNFNEQQMLYMMLFERDPEKFDTPARNRRELEPLLHAFRSEDRDEQAMLYRLLYFVGSDFRDLSYAVFDSNNLPTEFRKQALLDLGLAPTKSISHIMRSHGDKPVEEKNETKFSPSVPLSSTEAIRSGAKRVLRDLDGYVSDPVNHVNERGKLFDSWIDLSKTHHVGIAKLLSHKKEIQGVLKGYSAGLFKMVVQVKEIEKVVATLRVAVSLFKNLGQADINSLSAVVHSVLQVAERAIAGVRATLELLNRNGEHSYVNTIIQSTIKNGVRTKATEAWHDNLVRTQFYRMSAKLATIASNINHLKRALTQAPDEHIAVRINLFLKGVADLFDSPTVLSPHLLSMIQGHAMREISGSEPVVTIPAKLLDEIKDYLEQVQDETELEPEKEPDIKRYEEKNDVIESDKSVMPTGEIPKNTTRELINNMSLFFDYAVRSYHDFKQSDTGYKRAQEQVRNWLGELSFSIKEEDTIDDVLQRCFKLLDQRIQQRRKKSRLPGVKFNLSSFEIHMLLLMSPYIKQPDYMLQIDQSITLPQSQRELQALINRVGAKGDINASQQKLIQQRLLLSLAALSSRAESVSSRPPSRDPGHTQQHAAFDYDAFVSQPWDSMTMVAAGRTPLSAPVAATHSARLFKVPSNKVMPVIPGRLEEKVTAVRVR
ncbi:MAG: hypothetical protein P1U63_06595 [Coxiellaceae bacterium]|nr:hypothetical protein [Coxiellaceae bacterium]